MDTEVMPEGSEVETKKKPKKEKEQPPAPKKEPRVYRVRLLPRYGRTSEGEEILWVTGCDVVVEEAQGEAGVSTFSILGEDGSNVYCTDLNYVYDCIAEPALVREERIKPGRRATTSSRTPALYPINDPKEE